MKKKIIILVAIVIIIVSALSFTGCNRFAVDANLKLGYIVINENGHHVLHTINKWGDSESDSVTVRTRCCGNYIWTSTNNAVIYESKPNEYAFDMECGRS